MIQKETINNKSTENKNQLYKEILEHFTLKDHKEYYYWLMKPFNAWIFSCASDCHSIVLVPKCGDYEDRYDKMKEFFDFREINSITITKKQLLDSINLYLQDLKTEQIEEEIKCICSDGIYNHEFSYEGQQYKISVKCPACNGTGRIKKKINITTNEKKFKIGLSYFSYKRIQDLLFLCDKLQENKIHLISQRTSNEYSLFKIGEVFLILMPIIDDDKKSEFIEILGI